jgi:mevalonate kinase
MKNNTTVTVSAPGKLMLFGEHAVVYGYPCIVTAIDKRVSVTVTLTGQPYFELDAPQLKIKGYKKPIRDIGAGDVPKEVKCVEYMVRNYFKNVPVPQGIHVETQSDFSCRVGCGSSSATVVATLGALMKLFPVPVTEKGLFEIAYTAVLDIQGNGSGFDIASALHGGTLYFAGNGKIIEPLTVPSMPLVVGYTGVKADTVTLVESVAAKRKMYPKKVERIFTAIQKLVDEAKTRMTEGDWERAGKCMDFNQEYLRDLGVSSEKLETLISAAKKAGAYGAKLSGAGGGDCMIALYPGTAEGKLAVEKAITSAGGQVLESFCNAEGVRTEQNTGRPNV